MYCQKNDHFYLAILILVFFVACQSGHSQSEKETAAAPGSKDETVQQNIEALLSKAKTNNGKTDDGITLEFLPVLDVCYGQNEYRPRWSSQLQWEKAADEMLAYLDTSLYQGLFKEDYHYKEIKALHQTLANDSLHHSNSVSWAKADLLFTDAFAHLLQDLRFGRLPADSLVQQTDLGDTSNGLPAFINRVGKQESVNRLLAEVQPAHPGYKALQKQLHHFVDSMDTKTYTYLQYPYRDSLAFLKKLQLRFTEGGVMKNGSTLKDSAELANTIKKYQQLKGLKPDGKLSASVVKMLNTTDKERLKRIAITLDRYKQLPAKMPAQYIWVNLPAYQLKVWDNDSVFMESRIICGKPATPTPLLTSAISDMMIYPTWTVPVSIISKEMLPGLKRSSGYLARKGLNLLNDKGQKIDPSSVNWAKYTKGIPFKIQQESGDGNALGVIKFNFENPYAVYLHDTNQRYLFKNAVRSLSHGCVRVQDWQKLAIYILKSDSLQALPSDSADYNTNILATLLAAKERQRIDVKHKIPLFIRYFGCEVLNGSIKFYDDIYGEDRKMRERYFAGK
ncbi:MAG: L,D-transpeptidase family protein [Ferruginibacter sp.]|nr:L,D-transpeptidase family protein [Ferruginibacter sp.]